MVRVIEQCFASELTHAGWAAKLKEMIPSYGESLIDNAELCRKVRADTAPVLGLHNV
jgi:malate dehydrogenase (quinone)